MQAKEIFQELGYTKLANDDKSNITYVKISEKYIADTIKFNVLNKLVEVFYNYNNTQDNNVMVEDYKVVDLKKDINMQELKAINKQIEELGW